MIQCEASNLNDEFKCTPTEIRTIVFYRYYNEGDERENMLCPIHYALYDYLKQM